jgi:cell division protein FtsQ
MTTTQRPPTASPQSRPAASRRSRVVLWAAAGVALCLLALWLVAFSPVLGVRTVTVAGTHLLTPAEVRSAAALHSGSPLIRLDTSAVAHRVDRLPEVAAASVHVSYPGTVHITVTERVAVGYVVSGTKFTLVDRTGNQFRAVTVRPRGLPAFEVPAGAAGAPTARAVAGVAAALPETIRRRLSSVQALDPTSITLQLTDSRVVRWGSDERNADKARILPALLTQQGSQFDITDPDQVTVR